jgi:general secretion pathway protein E
VEEQIAYENILHEKRTKFYSGIGCNLCLNTGFLGRTGLFEILVMSERIKQMVVQGAISSDIKKQAMTEGMIPMIHDGMLKVRDGITTPAEVLRTVFYTK